MRGAAASGVENVETVASAARPLTLPSPRKRGEEGARPKPAREVAELAREGALRAVGRLIELIEHEDPRIAMAAANAVLDRAFGKSSAQPIGAEDDRPPAEEAAAASIVEALAKLSAGDRAELRALLAKTAGRSQTDGAPAEPRRRARKPRGVLRVD